jgi:hypothetical protein
MRLAHMHANGIEVPSGPPRNPVEAAFEHALAAAPEHAEHQRVDAVIARELDAAPQGHGVAVVIFAEQRQARLGVTWEARLAGAHEFPLRETGVEGDVSFCDRVPTHVDVGRRAHSGWASWRQSGGRVQGWFWDAGALRSAERKTGAATA